jgi:L-ribulokinase
LKKYVIGIDYGTLSARAILADAENGNILPHKPTFTYPHGVMTELAGKPLPSEFALQHPKDYIDALDYLIPELVAKNGVECAQIVGIGIDFTACTIFPLDQDREPLCFDKRFEENPHAYSKLWKHHGADKYAPLFEDAARKLYPYLLDMTGGCISGEFFFPKLYEIYKDAPEVYESASVFVNAGDYIASVLTGNRVHSMAYAAIKEHYDNFGGKGYPDRSFFEEIDGGFADVLSKVDTTLSPVSACAGRLNSTFAKRLGLCEGTAVSVPIIDAHGAISAAGIEDKRATFAIGTSAVIAVMTSEHSTVRGIHSQGYEPTAEKLHTLEAGVRAMGDLYDWFVKNCVPAEYERRAKESGMNIHAYLRSLAEKKKIGESRLIALDWFNGNRTVIPNDKLSGMILGLTLATRPEDIYRALIESTVFELRRVFDNYVGSGVEISSVVATGGIPLKDPMLMQILADTLNMPVSCLESTEATALGSAVYGATAAGLYGSVAEASQRMKQPVAKTYHPIAENTLAYAELYREYCKLYDYFAKGENKVMEYLHDLEV